ncbi:MAG: hypothetical protein MI824_19995, partial [Hyphomicrobiales bacterium]|nr:hypothetical protein [Hyphomicrobiales bacterium]
MRASAKTLRRIGGFLAVLVVSAQSVGTPLAAADYRQAVEKRFVTWVEQLRADALAAGITRETFDAAM